MVIPPPQLNVNATHRLLIHYRKLLIKSIFAITKYKQVIIASTHAHLVDQIKW